MAGATAGLVVAGVGGRLAMRVSMLIADGFVQGRITEGGNRIGEFTLEGTIGLLLFVGLLTGLIAGIIWYAIRPYLRLFGRGELLLAAVAAVGLGSTQIINPDNRDFVILEPAGRQVALFIGLVALTGLATALLDRTYDRHLSRRPGALLVYLPLVALGAVMLIPTFGTMLSEQFCFCPDPPRIAGYLLLGVFATTAAAAGLRVVGRDEAPRWLPAAGSVLTAGAVVAGLVHVALIVVEMV